MRGNAPESLMRIKLGRLLNPRWPTECKTAMATRHTIMDGAYPIYVHCEADRAACDYVPTSLSPLSRFVFMCIRGGCGRAALHHTLRCATRVASPSIIRKSAGSLRHDLVEILNTCERSLTKRDNLSSFFFHLVNLLLYVGIGRYARRATCQFPQ